MTLSRRHLARPLALALLLGAGTLSLTRPARAGRDPTPEERTRVEAALRRLGFERWDEIELDDGVWEVDDARTADGKEYDLKLHSETLEVIERKED